MFFRKQNCSAINREQEKLQSNLFNDQKINKRHPDPRLMATTETSRVVIHKHKKVKLLKPSLLAASINSASCSIDLSYPRASLSIVWIRARGSVPILVSMPLMNWYVVSFEINMKKKKEKGP